MRDEKRWKPIGFFPSLIPSLASSQREKGTDCPRSSSWQFFMNLSYPVSPAWSQGATVNLYRCRQGHGQASHTSLRLPFLFRLLGSPLPSHVDMHTVYVITWPDVSRRVRAPTPAASSAVGVLFKIWQFLITGLIFYDKSWYFPPWVNIWAHSKTGWMLCW